FDDALAGQMGLKFRVSQSEFFELLFGGLPRRHEAAPDLPVYLQHDLCFLFGGQGRVKLRPRRAQHRAPPPEAKPKLFSRVRSEWRKQKHQSWKSLIEGGRREVRLVLV